MMWLILTKIYVIIALIWFFLRWYKKEVKGLKHMQGDAIFLGLVYSFAWPLLGTMMEIIWWFNEK